MSGHTLLGVGLKGHRPQDRELHQLICDALERDPFLEASGIEVLVDGREVFLSGTVFTHGDRARAEQIAAEKSGSRTVYNRLELFSNGPVAESNLNTQSTIDGAVNPTPNGDYDVLS
jgi:osmotically-inducible protein OsmY